MRFYTGTIQTDVQGSAVEFEFEVADDATDEQIEEEAKQAAFDHIQWSYQEQKPKPGKPDFDGMKRPELSAWYVKNVGYDLGEDDPAMSLTDFRKQCAEMFELHEEG